MAEKNRDLNQSREKLEQMENIRRNLTEEIAALRTLLKERENEIESLREENERIRFDCEQEIQSTKIQVKEIIVRRKLRQIKQIDRSNRVFRKIKQRLKR